MFSKLSVFINITTILTTGAIAQKEAVSIINAPIVEATTNPEDAIIEPKFYFSSPYTSILIKEFENNNFTINISSNPKGYVDGLNEVCSYYCGEVGNIQFYNNGQQLRIKESDIPHLKQLIQEGRRRRQLYSSWLYYVNDTHNFQSIVDIQNFVMDWFDYSVTNANMWTAVKTQTGQCWHYAAVMANLCQINGMDAEMVVGNNHAWVVCDGVGYDPSTLDLIR